MDLLRSVGRSGVIDWGAIVVGIALGVFVGGGILRRKKRGRPDTWLYRQLQWCITMSYPLLAGWVRGQALITRSGRWTVRRGAR